jgi:protein-S-isoprenylcysteine O-methyltransferase Ste14
MLVNFVRLISSAMLKDYTFVSVQLLLFVAYAFDVAALGFYRPDWLGYPGLFLALSGVGTGVLALLQIRTSFSPFPTPVAHGELVTGGMFALSRHPIYSSLLVGAFGYALYTGSGYRVLIGVLLWVLFYFKSGYEEELLLARYPGYAEFQGRVGRFLRWI